MGTGKPRALGSCSTGSWETGGSGELWLQGIGSIKELGNHGHGETGSTRHLWHGGTGSSVQPGAGSSGQPEHREVTALRNWEHWTATAPGNWEHQDHHPTLELPARPGTAWQAWGVDFKMKTIEVDGIKVRIQIWDTAGQERYQTITKQYYRRAQGIFLVYDISSERSYQHIVKWASDVDEYAPDGVQKILIGNKADEEHKRQVPKEQGLQLAREYGMDFYETSACSNLNIKESFTRLTELVLQAHRKELDELRGLPRAPTLARLEEDEQQPLGSEDTPKTCWC